MAEKYYKFLAENLCSYHDPNFYYPMPTLKNGEWIPTKWISVDNYSENKTEVCGEGLHLMKILNPRIFQYKGNCFEAEGEHLLVDDEIKARFERIRLLRPIKPNEIFKPKANLRSANLSSANLRLADLYLANLSSANLSSADLYLANLSSADLYLANLRSANLRSAKNLNEAYNLDKAYWNKFTKIDNEFKKLLNKDRFIE